MSAIRPFRLFALAALMAAPAIYADGLKGDAAAGKALFMSSPCPTGTRSPRTTLRRSAPISSAF
jgi:hypothetical protein